MAVSLAHLPIWLWGGKTKGGKGMDPAPNGSSSEWGLGLRDLDNVRFPLVKGSKMASPGSGKVKRKWKSREERRRVIDKDYDNDIVLVPSDGGCLSGSESDDSDWSIGWLEPHAPDFQNDDEADNSFAVLVPCYRHEEIKKLEARTDNHNNHHHQFLDGINFLQTEYTDGKKHVEEWISSLQSY